MGDVLRSERPATSKTNKNVECRRGKVRSDRRITIKMIADELSANNERVRRIITKDLSIKKICAKMVPKFLNDQQKGRRVQVCQDILKELKTEPNVLSRADTDDEPWMEELSSSRPKKARLFKSKIKANLIVFFDVYEIVCIEFLPQDQTINQNVYKDILQHLMLLVREKRIVGD